MVGRLEDSPPLQGGACRDYGASRGISKIGLIDLNKALAGRLVPAREAWSEPCLFLNCEPLWRTIGIRMIDAMPVLQNVEDYITRATV